MTKKALTLAALAILTTALTLMAHDPAKGKAGEKTASGTIAKVDMDAKSFSVTDSKGGSSTVQWTDGTKIMGGELKEGATVKFGYSESDSKMWATWIRVAEGAK